MIVTVKDHSTLTGISGINRDVIAKIQAGLTFPNPQWIENAKRGFWNGNTPREFCFLENNGDGFKVPRGFTRQLVEMLKQGGIRYEVEDKRCTLREVDLSFCGQLKGYQRQALDDILRRDFGTVSMPTGSGKTVVALAVIAARKQPALIVVHTKELLEQWINRIETFLGIPSAEVGIIGGGKHVVGDRVTVALVQSLYKCAQDVAPRVGFLVVDECHRTPSRTFTEAVTVFDCRFMLGLSATPWRRDGLSRLIYWYLGDKVFEIEKSELIETGDILPAEVIVRGTAFQSSCDPSTDYSTMLSELTQNDERNRLIISDVVKESLNSRGVCLVLSDRRAHCETLRGLLSRRGLKVAVLTGDVSPKQRQRIVQELNSSKVKVLLATGQLIGEGFDCRGLTTLFLATPIKFSGRLIQYLGRVLRPAPGKDRARVFDYIDGDVGVLRAAARARQRVYQNAS